MNEEKLNELAAEIEIAVATEFENNFDESNTMNSIETIVEREVENAMENLVSEIASQIAREFTLSNILGNSELVFVIKEKLEEALAKDAEEEQVDNEKLRYVPNSAGEMYLRYNGTQPETVSSLIDAIIVLTSDEQSVLQFFNRIATLREYAIAIKNKSV